MIKLIGFDADDTLWHCEREFRWSIERFTDLIARDGLDREALKARLIEKEIENIKHFGYGVKGFTLSMIETAIEVTNGTVDGKAIGEIIRYGRRMLAEEIELLPGAREAVSALSRKYRLHLITKGDLFDQENKIARSGLADFFEDVHIVSTKNEETYLSLLNKLGATPDEFAMVGNSLKSEVLPVVKIGARAFYVPYRSAENYLERVDESLLDDHPFTSLKSLGELDAALESPPGKSPR